jgi:hypothetical protein
MIVCDKRTWYGIFLALQHFVIPEVGLHLKSRREGTTMQMIDACPPVKDQQSTLDRSYPSHLGHFS